MKAIFAAIFVFLTPLLLHGAGTLEATNSIAIATATTAAAAHEVEPLVRPDAPVICSFGPVHVTNSMIYTLIVGAVIIIFVRVGTSELKMIPSGAQNVVEAVVEGLHDLVAGLLEPKVAQWCFPLVATYFIFILTSNLMGLIPGVGSIGWGPGEEHSSMPFAISHVTEPLFRPPTSDANMTIAMAGIFFIMSTYWAFKYNGVVGLGKHIFGVKGGMKGAVLIPLTLIFGFIGVIEVVSLLIRPIALAMRLYGNIYGGESVLALMLPKAFGLAALPFYVLELVVAIVQAMVFTILCIAFISTMCSHSDDEGEGHKQKH